MKRYIIDAYGPDVAALESGFAWLVGEAGARGTEAAVVVPALDGIGNLSAVIGDNAAAAGRKRRLIVVNGVRVHLFTPKTQPYSFGGPVLVPWANTEMVESAERLSPPAICATGWSDGDLDEWKLAHAPIDPRSGEPQSKANSAPSSVRGAVASLSGLANDVLHPSDKRQAVNAFKALRLCGAEVDPGDVRALAIQNGWRPEAADRLREIANKVGQGRAVRGGSTISQSRARELVAYFEETAIEDDA